MTDDYTHEKGLNLKYVENVKKKCNNKKTQYDKYHLCAVCELNLLKNFAYFNWHSAA